MTTFSQTVTPTKSPRDTCKTILTCDQAKRVVVDLLKGDSAIAELKITQTLLEQVREQSAVKDADYDALNYKLTLSDKALVACMDAGKRSKSLVTRLEADNAKLVTRTKRWRRLSGALALLAGGILLFK